MFLCPKMALEPKISAQPVAHKRQMTTIIIIITQRLIGYFSYCLVRLLCGPTRVKKLVKLHKLSSTIPNQIYAHHPCPVTREPIYYVNSIVASILLYSRHFSSVPRICVVIVLVTYQNKIK